MFNKIICFNYHWHNFSEMHYLISFNFQHFFGGRKFFFSAGDVIYWQYIDILCIS